LQNNSLDNGGGLKLDSLQEKYRSRSLEALFKNSLDAIVSIDENYCIVDINQVFADLFGYSLTEVQGRHVDDVMNMGKTGTANIAITARVLAGESVEEEGTRYRKDGSPVEVLIKGIPVIIDGKMAGGFGIYEDITERKRAEKLLRESEAKNRSILSTFPDLMFIYDRNGVYLDYHVSQYDLLAAEPQDFLGKTIYDILPADIAKLYMQSFTRACDTGQVQLIEYPLTVMSGQKYFETRLSQIDDQRILAVIRDITDRKKTLEELQNQRERLENVIEGSGVGTWEWDTQTDKTIYNENWAKMLGFTLDELQPVTFKVFETLVHPDDLKKSKEIADRHLAGELPFYECELRMKHKDGHWIWVLDRGRILTRSPDGKPLTMFGTHTDITERKLTEEKVHFMSLHDGLTGLYNRTYIEVEMKRLDTARQMPLSIIMADLNGLKLINDTYGHPVGDQALCCAAEIIRKTCREDDIFARWGGDEFVILLPQTTADEAFSLCKRISDSCRAIFIEDVPVSMALGVACKIDPKDTMTSTLRDAENSMYKQKLTESRSTKSAVLKALLKTLEAKSFETEAHTRGMQKIAQLIGRQINLPDAELSRLELLITLHDIGKINIAEEILIKDGPLTAEEWETIRKHPEIGFRIARATEEFAHVAEDILAHHEKWDGSGYPQGLSGSSIPFLARITAIADAYEVMTNGRPYKKSMSFKEVKIEFERCSGIHFDPELVDIFLAIHNKMPVNPQ
jgi:diguanylate cyclase (GGDEF)-like protein/PAS domain S-box-containing protein